MSFDPAFADKASAVWSVRRALRALPALTAEEERAAEEYSAGLAESFWPTEGASEGGEKSFRGCRRKLMRPPTRAEKAQTHPLPPPLRERVERLDFVRARSDLRRRNLTSALAVSGRLQLGAF